MSLKQYLVHILYWLRVFPLWNDDTHTYVGITGHPESTCLVCNKVVIDEDDQFDLPELIRIQVDALNETIEEYYGEQNASID